VRLDYPTWPWVGEREMKKKQIASLGNALIWAAAILASSIVLRWGENPNMIVVILGGAAGASILTVSNALKSE